ncbi:hypothetical protein HNV11_13460 [Spirosoma taeanense]|uniref:Uncharacterized protein n=1 Tax=Spirosoma taeanense TaxID=2735870 RepID=A0A6M5YAK0_9BACT|nr:hypothetical protein [Spirosoma taeanense]QJW90310.1 hypothetical protein HNV11_13460 [Spirosoma taeanense]
MQLTRYSLTKLLPFALLSLLACEPKTDNVITSDDPNVQLPSPGTPTAVGQLIGAPVTKTIGLSGGSLVTPDGKFSLTFPAGAVSRETVITIQAVETMHWAKATRKRIIRLRWA